MNVKNTASAGQGGASSSQNVRMEISPCLGAEKKALELIKRAEQNTFTLRHKLEKRGYDSKCINTVIEKLCETGLLDDSRYAELWLESRIYRGAASSPLRLIAGLSSRGIARDIIDDVLKKTLDEEKELKLIENYAKKIMRKNNYDLNDPDSAHSFRYKLKNEGFSSSAINNFFENSSMSMQ